jgi:hypothetical protein
MEEVMESEISRLQDQVAALEAALAEISDSKRRGHGRRPMRAALLVGIVVLIAVGITHALSISAAIAPQAPSKVAAPFEVVDGKGRTLFKIQMSASGAGLGIFYDETGEEVAIIGQAKGNGLPAIRVLDKGIDKVGIGTSQTGDGFIRVGNKVDSRVQLVGGEDASVEIFTPNGNLVSRMFKTKSGEGAIDIAKGGKPRVELGIAEAGDCGIITLYSNTTQARTILLGDYGIRQTNAQGQPAFQAGVDDSGLGYAMAANRAGAFVSKISSDGSVGRVEVSTGGEVRALMSIKLNGKGDVYANGDKGTLCLSNINPTY